MFDPLWTPLWTAVSYLAASYFAMAVLLAIFFIWSRHKKWWRCRECEYYFSECGERQMECPDDLPIKEGVCGRCLKKMYGRGNNAGPARSLQDEEGVDKRNGSSGFR